MYKFNEVAKFILETDYLLPKETPEEMLELANKMLECAKGDE
jgi:hypothetical protein